MAVETIFGLEAPPEVLDRLCADVVASAGATSAVVLGPDDENAGSTRIIAPSGTHLDWVVRYLFAHPEWGTIMRTSCA